MSNKGATDALKQIVHQLEQIGAKLDEQEAEKDMDDLKCGVNRKRNRVSDFCVGTVTILTTNLLAIIGRITDLGTIKGEEFIVVTLTEPLLGIPGSGDSPEIQPYYTVGDTIQVNLDQVESIGPTSFSVDE